jgi:hypothetical protein
MGYLAYKSGWLPKALGVLLIAGCGCYLVDMLAQFLVPDFGQSIHAFVTIPSAIAELWMVGYLLVIGVRIPKPGESLGESPSGPEQLPIAAARLSTPQAP